jgi:hypothetical protein
MDLFPMRDIDNSKNNRTRTKKSFILELSPNKHKDNNPRDNTNKKNDGDKDSLLEFERPYYEQCTPIVQPTIHPTCNTLHEIMTTTSTTPTLNDETNHISLLSTKGSWRSAWKVDIPYDVEDNKNIGNITSLMVNHTSSVILKMLHLHRSFNYESFKAHATDIMVMDTLTASPYIVSAYGYCGQSVVTEFATSSGRDYVKRYDIRSRDRLKVARDLARGLADLQALQPLVHHSSIQESEFPPPIRFAHNDINIANTVMVGDQMKWNDFNIGVFMRQRRPEFRSQQPPKTLVNDPSFTPFPSTNNDNNSIDNRCPAPVKFRSDLWRSPEEIRNTTYVYLEQSDIYGFGNILYQTMSRRKYI